LDLGNEDQEFIDEYKCVIDDKAMLHADVADAEEVGVLDPYLNMERGLPRGEDGELAFAQVKRRAVDVEGRPIGRLSSNPILDSRQYEVEFLDGETEILTANLIAENLLVQVDKEGRGQMMINEIVDHRVFDNAIPKSEGTYTTTLGMKRKRHTTIGLEIFVQWKDSSLEWLALKDLKESYPVQLAAYSIMNNLKDEPTFAWWVPFVIKKRDAIISKLKTKYWQCSTKYGICISKSVDEARHLDDKNKNYVWMDAVNFEMETIRVAFELHNGDTKDLIGYQEITGRSVFDVKLGENFRHKAILRRWPQN
jgi:hypothetical protein